MPEIWSEKLMKTDLTSLAEQEDFYNQWTQKTEKDQGLKSQTCSSEEKED